MKKKMFLIVVTMLLLFSTTATVFAASGEVVQPRTTQSFSATFSSMTRFGGLTKIMPGTSGYIYPKTNSAGVIISGTIYEQVNGTYYAVSNEKTLAMNTITNIPFNSPYGVAGRMCKGMVRNAYGTVVQTTVTGTWDAS